MVAHLFAETGGASALESRTSVGLRATLGEIAGALRETPIERTAIILVGPTLAAQDFGESELYNADYVPRFRAGDRRGEGE